jgi:prophage regulatory protein
MPNSILRLTDVMAQSGYPRSSLYLRISQGLWPKPISLGARSVGWPSSEIDILNSARIAGKNDNEIRALVNKLQKNRSVAFKEVSNAV